MLENWIGEHDSEGFKLMMEMTSNSPTLKSKILKNIEYEISWEAPKPAKYS